MNRTLAAAFFLLGSACSHTNAARFTGADVKGDAESLLSGCNSGNYAVFSRNWTPGMKAAVSEEVFVNFRKVAADTLGPFIEVVAVKPAESKQPDVTAYAVTCRFEKQAADVRLAYRNDGQGIDLVVFESVGASPFPPDVRVRAQP